MAGATPLGWRLAVAILGTLTILLVARAVLRMTGSALWCTVAGLLMAIDGMAIVMSRTAVLDGILTFFVVAAFACLLVDRDWARAGRTAGYWWRPWRWLAAVSLGLACGVKWSGIWFVAAFCVMTVLWDGVAGPAVPGGGPRCCARRSGGADDGATDPGGVPRVLDRLVPQRQRGDRQWNDPAVWWRRSVRSCTTTRDVDLSQRTDQRPLVQVLGLRLAVPGPAHPFFLYEDPGGCDSGSARKPSRHWATC